MSVAIPLVMVWAGSLVDIFRRADLKGGNIAGWIALFLLFPFIGVFAYSLARPQTPLQHRRHA